jgi:AraC-like DNA-binding protein
MKAQEIPAIFHDGEQGYYADTCEPLKQAATAGEVALHAWGRARYPGAPLPANRLPEVRSVGVWDAPGKPAWGLTRHCNEGIEFAYLERGSTAFEVDGGKWLLRKGHLTITRPWQFHAVGDPAIGASRLTWLILDVGVRRPNQTWCWPAWLLCSPEELLKLTRLLSQNEQPVWQASAEIEHWFVKLATLLEIGEEPAAAESKLKLYVNGLLLAVLEMFTNERIPLDAYLSSSQRAVQMFLQALPDYAGHDWGLATMAAQSGLSRTQFSAYCKELTGLTPLQYLLRCRVEQAAQLLAERPELSITDIAFACGFNSSQYLPPSFAAQPVAHRRNTHDAVRG